MTINLGVKALLSWVKSIKLSQIALTLDDLKDGAVLLEVVCMLKKEPTSCYSNSIEERFTVIADFVEKDCRFSSTKGSSLSWDNIRSGINQTIEIAKVLLLLVYHDIMNDRLTLNMLECDVEREIANLTGSFVMESNGCVYLGKGLDAYLARKHLPVAREIFERSATTSTSNVSTVSSFSDDESPVFHRSQKVQFQDVQTVASSSVSKSPLQEILNTPKFQLRKIQRQMMKERDYRDGLERELASKLALIAQRESHINQLQYRLDKIKEEQGDHENVIREQLNELQTRNDTLQIRLNDMVKQNKDFKSNTSLMERKVDELSDENGVLSSQVRTVCSQLAIFEAEVGRLTETQASTQDEWRSKTSHLQSELNQATSEKELLTEQIQILQGKISCLEEEFKRATEQEVGENMGPVKREIFDLELDGLKNELESTFYSLKKAEVEIEAKTQQLAEYQQEINQQKELLKQQEAQTEAIIQAKDDILDKLEKEFTEQRAVIQQEIQDLNNQLEQVEQQKTEQMTILQQQIAACEQEIEKLKEIKKEKEDLLLHTEENVKYLETKLSAASSLLADKDQQIDSLRKEVSILTDKTQNDKNEIQSKEEMLAKLLMEKSNEQDIFCNKIQSLTVQVEDLSSSLKQAEQEIQLKQDLLAKTQQENVQQREVLQQQIVTCEEEVQKLNEEIQVKNNQLLILKKESSQQSDLLEHEIAGLKGQLEHLNDSLRKTEDQVQTQKVLLTKQEQQSAHQTEALQQQLFASEERVRSMNEEIQTREEQMNMLKNQSSQQSELLHKEIQELNKQVECFSSSLKNAENNLQSKDDLLAEQQLQGTRDMESLQTQMASSQDMVKMLNTEIQAKEEQLILLKTETTTHSELLQQEIESLNKQIERVTDSLEVAKNQAQAKEDLMAKQEQESTLKIETLGKHSAALEEEVNRLRKEIQTKEGEVDLLKVESCKESQVLHDEIQTLKDQVQSLNESLKTTIEQVQDKEILLTQKEMEISQEKGKFENMITMSKEEVRGLREQIQTKEQQLATLEKESSTHSDMLQQEISCLKTQLANMSDSLTRQEQEGALQKELLQQQLSSSEEEVRKMKDEIQAKEEQMRLLKTDCSVQSDLLHQEIQELKNQVECLRSSLKNAENNLQSKDDLLAEQQLQGTLDMESLQTQMVSSQDMVMMLNTEIQAKEEQFILLKTETTTHSELLQQEIESLNKQIERVTNSLEVAKNQAQAKEDLLAKQEQESTLKIETLGKHSDALKEEVNRLREEIQTKEGEVDLLKVESCKESQVLHDEIQTLKGQVQSLNESLKTTKEQVQDKENLLTEIERFENMITEKESLLLKAEEKLQILQTEFSAVNTLITDKDQILITLRDEVAAKANLIQKAMEEAEANEKLLAEMKEKSSNQTDVLQHEILCLKGEMETATLNLLAKEQLLLETQRESAEQIELLQQQLVAIKAELNQYKETNAADLRLNEAVHVATIREKDALAKEKEVLMSRIFQSEKNQKALEKQHEALMFENERLAQAKQAIERENTACRELESVLQQELENLKMEKQKVKLLKAKEKAEEIETLKRDLQEQLSAKSVATEHYKAQMEKAMSHYNGKKQLLQESHGEVVELKQSLEVKEREVKATTMEKQLLQLDLDKALTNEKALLSRVASLEAQLAFADRNLREQNKIHGYERSAAGSCYLEVPFALSGVNNRAQVKRTESSDSLDQSSLEDSLNNTRKLSAPDESSTPLVRSSERLAAKRQGLQAESLETLYFTPINNRHINKTSTGQRMVLDSTCKNPTSSVKRRRTTQVINITMTKKTPGSGEDEETFYSLASAHSHPNLSSAHSARAVPLESFDTPARMTSSASDQLIGLPGYRRSTVNAQSASTFCAGVENEPEGAPDDWRRIAELQARNKACLPHLKSSYPVESDPCRGSTFLFTDEELRMGEPSDTIRRASMMPGQLQDSLASHRHSFMLGHSGVAASTRSHRLSLMPGQLPSKAVSSSQLKGTKRASSTLSMYQTSPEKKVKASCFPRPLTPRNQISGPSSSHLHPALSPADRRQSMAFSIDNTPKNSNYLKKGLNKLRSSTRKSPGKSLKKSPAQTSVRKCQENIHAGVVRTGRIGSSKSPQVASKAPQVASKAQRATSRSAKSPLTSSARKMMSRLKV